MTRNLPASDLKYDISTLPPGGRVLDAFPALSNNPIFVAHGSGKGDPYLRLAIWYADKGSEYRDLPLDTKKEQCMTRVGIAPNDPRRAGIINWSDEPAVAMITEYVRLQGSLDFALWFHGTEAAWQTIQQLSSPIHGFEMDEAKLQTAYKLRRDNLDAMFMQVPRLEQLRNQLFMGDEELAVNAARSLQKKTPVAERRSEGRSFIPKTTE